MERNAAEAARQICEEYLMFRSLSHSQYVDHPRMTPSEPDREFFSNLVEGEPTKPTRESHHRLQYAYDKISERLHDRLGEGFSAKRFNELEKLRQLLDHNCYVVRMLTSEQTAGFNLFSVLNDRGISLSTGNLLRAESLAVVEGFRLQQKSVEKDWDEILRDKASLTDDFISWYYSANRGARIRAKDMFRDFRDSFLVRRPAKITTSKANGIRDRIGDLRDSVETMRRVFAGEWPRRLKAPATEWDQFRLRMLIEHLGHKNCMPLLFAATKLSDKHLSEVVRTVELFVFRYRFICREHIGPATRIYERQAKRILDTPTTFQPKMLRQDLRALIESKAKDEVFVENLKVRMDYAERRNRQLIKYFLLTLSDYWGWYQNGGRGLQRCLQNHRVLSFDSSTLEHIYPQSAKVGDRDRTLENVKHTLGNLTLLGPNENSREGNEIFKKKRAMYNSSAVELNHDIGKRRRWDVHAVLSREKELLDAALKVFFV